jgi:hypothetical protein
MPRDNTLIQLIKKEDVNGSAAGSDFGEASLRVFCATVLGKQPDQPCELGAYSLCEEGGRVMWLWSAGDKGDAGFLRAKCFVKRRAFLS